MRVLGIETSCDETGVALLEDWRVLVDLTKTQMQHAEFGGVVPEIAARTHLELLPKLLLRALEESRTQIHEIELVAATRGPGLPGALLVGLSFAKGLAQALGVPFLGVNHLEAHIYSLAIGTGTLPWPLLALVVSGGHTELVWCPGPGKYQLLGATRDDAAGEAFDKVARLLGLGWPGGPEIERVAGAGDPKAIPFTRARVDGLDFSFAGLKTAVLYYVRRLSRGELAAQRADIAASFQEAVVDMLLDKTLSAWKRLARPIVGVVGGVANNKRLRERFREALGGRVVFPEPRYTTDNGAMVAACGLFRFQLGERTPLDVGVDPSLGL